MLYVCRLLLIFVSVFFLPHLPRLPPFGPKSRRNKICVSVVFLYLFLFFPDICFCFVPCAVGTLLARSPRGRPRTQSANVAPSLGGGHADAEPHCVNSRGSLVSSVNPHRICSGLPPEKIVVSIVFRYLFPFFSDMLPKPGQPVPAGERKAQTAEREAQKEERQAQTTRHEKEEREAQTTSQLP